MAVEFRSRVWFSAENLSSTLDWLTKHNLGKFVDFHFATSWKQLIFLTFSIEILCIFHAVLSRNKFQKNSVYFIPFNPISDKAKKKKEKKLILQDKSSAKGRYES